MIAALATAGLMRHRRRRRRERLVYAYARCDCGALYAYDPRQKPRPDAWDCSDIILGLTAPSGKPAAVRHRDRLPFTFWKVKKAPTDWALAHRRERRIDA